MKTRAEAQELLEEWVKSDSLRKHCLGVAVCVEAYAEKLGEDKNLWYICGLLHDMDWERHPVLEEHPKPGCDALREKGYPEEMIIAILGHNAYHKVPRESKLSKVLFAVDELSGLVVALAKVRPGNFSGMSPKSVRKAMKKKDFAVAISRDDIRLGMGELNLDSDEKKDGHLELVIKALFDSKEKLGF